MLYLSNFHPHNFFENSLCIIPMRCIFPRKLYVLSFHDCVFYAHMHMLSDFFSLVETVFQKLRSRGVEAYSVHVCTCSREVFLTDKSGTSTLSSSSTRGVNALTLVIDQITHYSNERTNTVYI